MLVPGSANPLLLKSAAATPTGYSISRSLRFNSSDSAYCSRVPASAGNRKTWTWAGWVKRSSVSSAFENMLFSASGYSGIRIEGDNTLLIFDFTGSFAYKLATTQVLRDLSAWYHLVFALDTTQSTASNRLKLYINGTEVTQFSATTYPSLNYDGFVNATTEHNIGRNPDAPSQKLDAYLADIYFIDGQALTPSSFTETDATTGQLVPKAFSGSYGSQGWHLEFADNSSNTASTLGKDTSPNGNHWTPVNLSINSGGPTSVAAASGALPILNTTGTYGTAVGSGVRDDAFAGTLACAVPLGTASGLNTTDQSPTGRASAVKTVTNNSGTNNTSISQFYGGSLYINGASGSRLYVDGFTSFASNYSTDFTIECWVYPVAITNNGYLPIFHNDRSGVPSTFFVYWNGSGFGGNGLGASYSTGASANRWYHIAFVRRGSTNTLYVNGIATLSSTSAANSSAAYAFLILGERIQSDSWNYRGQAYYSDLRAYETAKYTSNFNPPSSTQNATIAAGNDSLVDVPTSSGTDTGVGNEVRGNYCTWNPLDKGSNVTLTNGNLDVSTNSTWNSVRATFGITSGKWYWEYTMSAAGYTMVGIGTTAVSLAGYIGQSASGYAFYSLNGNKWNSGTAASYGNSFTTNDVVGVAFDADSGKIWFSKNGTWQASGDPAAGTNAAYTSIPSSTYFPTISQDNSLPASTGGTLNAGARSFAYTAPSGFKALCTANLPAPLVTKPSTVMDVKLYTGNGSTQSITGLAFSPDLVWLKVRSAAVGHGLFDQVRGAGKALYSHATNAEYDYGTTSSGELYQFNSDGFNLGSFGVWNVSSQTSVAWTWDAGTTTVTNTQGSITSSVRANATAGFSVVTYTGAGASRTFGHGLNVAPQFFLIKRRDISSSWIAWHTALGNSDILRLESTNATQTIAGFWQGTRPTSSLIYLDADGTVNGSGGTYVAYCFAPVVGYSSFGSYTGNGSSDGVFQWCGFRPRWILLKSTGANGASWTMFDTARSTYNQTDAYLFANSSSAEGNAFPIDILSNGFKLRTNDGLLNSSSYTYVWAAFAESPFNYSRAR